ncbi:hypothetical protein ABT369_21995 [Dactylosporangium sp. NPDC000244]|uniref:hypothetical protein n=1 Tax=Dactylosporangium sp. NPDC000244 TaxID=3154365 RepID=UPI003327AD45
MRVVEGLSYLALASVGAGLHGHAVVSVGLLRRPTTQRMWGTLGALPRARFVAYFGGLGLAWFIAVWLVWFWRGEPYTVPIAAALAAVALVLAAGWAVAVLRRAR